MKKPIIEEGDYDGHEYCCNHCRAAGYNEAIEEYEKYLPSEEEIAIICYLTLKPATKEDWKAESKEILNEFRGYGKAIAKRIGKE